MQLDALHSLFFLPLLDRDINDYPAPSGVRR